MDSEHQKFVDGPRKRMASTESRFVVIGSGSAGRRHALALRALFPDAPITVVKRSPSLQPLDVLHAANISIVPSLEEACSTKLDFAAIASPATLHRTDLEYLSRHCSQFLLEKPIAAELIDGQEIVTLAERTGLQVSIGHHLRFSDTPRAFIDEVSHHSSSHLKHIGLSYGQHLRHWRPGVPSERTVTARKDLGGGVLRELSHEIDAAWLLVSTLRTACHALLSRSGAPTDGLVDTVADFILTSDEVEVNIHLDMTSDVPYRMWEAVFEDVSIHADLLAGTVTRVDADGQTRLLHESEPGERDRAGISLMRAVLGIGDDDARFPCDIHQGLRILNTIEAVEESAASGKPVAIRE